MGENLWVRETWIDAEERAGLGDSDLYETSYTETGELYRAMQREYGRCISKVYIDTEDGPRPIGWVFQGRVKYEDGDGSYLRETWVSVHDKPDTVTRERHYHYLGAAA